MDRRIVAQLFDCIDQLISASKEYHRRPTVIASNDSIPLTSTAASGTVSASASTAALNTVEGPATTDSPPVKEESAPRSGYVVLIAATNK